jgi:hypothetical protein
MSKIKIRWARSKIQSRLVKKLAISSLVVLDLSQLDMLLLLSSNPPAYRYELFFFILPNCP